MFYPFATTGFKDFVCTIRIPTLFKENLANKLRDKIIFEWHTFPTNENDLEHPHTFHAGYIIGGSQIENKVYSFFHIYFHVPWLTVSTGALHTNTFEGIYYLTK